jgi:hypothetical protein
VANHSTREVFSLDLDPSAHSGKPKQWEALGIEPPRAIHFTGDVLDLHPLLVETETRFDLILANPPFSLRWPVRLLHETLAQGLGGKFIDSTHATLRMLPTLLSEAGEAMMIANQGTLEKLYKDHPDDFRSVWAWISVPNFFPGVDPSLRVGVLYFSGNHDVGPLNRKSNRHHLSPTSRDDLALLLLGLRHDLFGRACITQPWEATTATRPFTACGDEMLRRNDPTHSRANVTLAFDVTDPEAVTYTGIAQRPGDVVRSMKGDTIEVINTDAEGRLVLADVLWYAQERFNPSGIVDLATLTGAMVVSLGHENTGVFSNDDALCDALLRAAKTEGEGAWRLPMGEGYDALIKSRIADMKNVGPRGAGAISAAQFLARFIKPGMPWCHLDIAGTASVDADTTFAPRGATGWGVLTLDRLIRDKFEPKTKD